MVRCLMERKYIICMALAHTTAIRITSVQNMRMNSNGLRQKLTIIGGAKFIGNSYINHATYKQDTIYKMRWSSAATHQYATDIGWAYKQVTRMYSLYNLLDNYTLYYDIPVYNK